MCHVAAREGLPASCGYGAEVDIANSNAISADTLLRRSDGCVKFLLALGLLQVLISH